MKHLIGSIFTSAALVCAPDAGRAAQVTVFAAASLTDALREIATAYEKQSADRMVFNFASSGVLERQIKEGAPADIFFSADEARADALETNGVLVKGTRTNLLANSLVAVTAADSSTVRTPGDLTNTAVQRVAIGDPKTVPAGTYGKAYLQEAGLWPWIERKSVPCESVRAVLAAVESGNADAGLVYKTDAAISRKVRVAFEVPAGKIPAIKYPAALVKDAPHAEAARKFLEYLAGSEAAGVFARRGFVVLSRTGK